MSMDRYNSFGDFHRSVDDMFRQFSRDFFSEAADPFARASAVPALTLTGPQRGELSAAPHERVSMRMDMVERPDHYAIHVDLPGMAKEDVKISLEGNVLTVGAERTEQRTEERENYHFRERKFGRMSRSIRLPSDVAMEQAQAKYENGELTISLPKQQKEADHIKTIEIQ